ncbi:Transposon Ty3-I Gag-Pol polyprotein [Vitis vinifera]|uniref:Transposon Ty3-I Gag-Pol polyprotein n=1 Tax=Vitis vinifera TaxID=29760 RepID=A0A438HFP7_VITVI|nr:Transposon Ty3-I Gag-Pol polyprotein [Vitis vinifera]
MLFTPFNSLIINYEPPRGFLMLKFSAYDRFDDPFDHIMHYPQLMTLDIGNDALLCKYVRLGARSGETSRNQASAAPSAPVVPRAIINYIHDGPLDEEYNSKRKRQRLLRAALVREHVSSIRPGLANESTHPIDGVILFPPVDPVRVLQPHRDALILTLGIDGFDVRRILVDPGSLANLLQVSVIKQMGFMPSNLENLGRILLGFNEASTTSIEDIVLPIQVGPITLNVQFLMVEDLSPFNAILGRAWLHNMKAIPSTYHQMVSFITKNGQIDLYGIQLAARQCYQVAREVGSNNDYLLQTIQVSEEEDHFIYPNSLLEPNEKQHLEEMLQQNKDVFAWTHSDMLGIHLSVASHWLNKIIQNEVDKLLAVGFIREVEYPKWLANVVVVPKKEGKWRVYVDYTNLNNACPKDSFPLPWIDQIVDSTIGHGMLSFLDAFFGYHQIPMALTDEEKTAFITLHGLYCYKVMPFRLKNT